MFARIYRPAKVATQSGKGKSQVWVLEFTPESSRTIDPLMGWTGSGDMRSQVKLRFKDKQTAIRHAEKHGIPFQVLEPQERETNVRDKGYGANFASDRREGWTH